MTLAPREKQKKSIDLFSMKLDEASISSHQQAATEKYVLFVCSLFSVIFKESIFKQRLLIGCANEECWWCYSCFVCISSSIHPQH
jgi:hypothetical protein